MRNLRKIWILLAGIALGVISYKFDDVINLIFKNLDIPIFDIIFGIITNFGIVVLLLVAIPSLILYRKKKKIAFLLWLNFFISILLTLLLKLIIARQRPIEGLTYSLTHILNYSFPSMHSVVAFSMLAMLITYLPKQRYFWTSFAILVGFSRVYLGFHFLSDVVFGALIGYFAGYYSRKIYEKYYGKNK